MVYDDASTMRDARAAYFEANAFGDDGGYALKWAPVKVLGVGFKIPNTQARVRALRFHDLHHVLTGYETDFAGEAQIGAWELRSGCGRFPAAVVLNLGTVFFGLVAAPGPMLRAFARGRATRNLYRSATFDDALLARTVGEVRRELGLTAPPPTPRTSDTFGLAFTWLCAALLGVLVAAIAIGPVAALVIVLLRRL